MKVGSEYVMMKKQLDNQLSSLDKQATQGSMDLKPNTDLLIDKELSQILNEKLPVASIEAPRHLNF